MPGARLQGISRCRVCGAQIVLPEATTRWRHVPPAKDEHAAIRAYLPKPMERARARDAAAKQAPTQPRAKLTRAAIEARVTAGFVARNRPRPPAANPRPKKYRQDSVSPVRRDSVSPDLQIADRFYRDRIRKTASVPTARRLGLGPVMKADDET